MACGEHGHFAVEKGQKLNFEFLPINIRNKEGRYMLLVYALGRIFNAHKSEYFFISDENRNNFLCIQRL